MTGRKKARKGARDVGSEGQRETELLASKQYCTVRVSKQCVQK